MILIAVLITYPMWNMSLTPAANEYWYIDMTEGDDSDW